MRYLRENTATRITIGPFYDVTDGITPEIALTVTNCFLTFIVDDAGVPTLVLDTAPTASGGANDMVHITSDAGGYYDLELAAANVNYTGRATLSIHDTDVHLPVFHEFQIVSANVYDSLFTDGDVLDVSAIQHLGTAYAAPTTAGVPEVELARISGQPVTAAGAVTINSELGASATAMDNFEDQYDTTGLTGDTFPATQSQLSGLANVGSASHKEFSGEVLTTPATTTSGSFADTKELDGVYMNWDSVSGGFNAELTGNIGSGTPSGIKITGYIQGNNDAVRVQMWDAQIGTPAWATIGAWTGKATASNEVLPFDAFISMVGIGANKGDIRLRLYNDNGTIDTALTSANIYIDQVFIEFSPSAASTLDRIYYDSNASNTGTVPGQDGVPGNPVSTMAAVNTLLASTGLNRVEVAPASTATLAAAQSNQVFSGENWVLELESQNIAGSSFIGANVSGIATGTGTQQTFRDCHMAAVTHIKGTHIHESGVAGTQTVGEAGEYHFDRCHSSIAGVDTWTFDFGAAIGNTNLNWRNSSGGIQLESMGDTGTDTASIEGRGQIIEGTCTGGIVAVRGLFETSGITNLTLVDGARFQSEDLVDDIWDEPLTGATHNVATSSGRRLRQLSVVPFLEGTVVDATATTTVIETSLTGYGDSFFSDALFLVELATDEWQARPVASYVSVTGEFTLDEALTSAPANGVNISIQVTHIHPVTEISSQVMTDLDANGSTVIDELTTQGDTNEAAIGALNNIADSDVLTQVNAALDTAIAELGVAAPTATPTLRTGLMLMYMMARNRVDVDTTGTDALKVYNNAGTQITSKAITDDGTDYSEAEMS